MPKIGELIDEFEYTCDVLTNLCNAHTAIESILTLNRGALEEDKEFEKDLYAVMRAIEDLKKKALKGYADNRHAIVEKATEKK